jgi:hypothetical protein
MISLLIRTYRKSRHFERLVFRLNIILVCIIRQADHDNIRNSFRKVDLFFLLDKSLLDIGYETSIFNWH